MNVNQSADIKRSVIKLMMLAIVTGSVSLGFWNPQADAADWAFSRSYYSHDLPPEVAARYPRPQSRSAYRLPQLATTPGFALKGVRRWNYVRMFNGNSFDTTILRSDTFDVVSP